MQFYDMILDEEQEAFVKAIKDKNKTIIFCDAAAGTGKTTLAMGTANLLYRTSAMIWMASCISSAPMAKGSRATSLAPSLRNLRSIMSLPIRP